MLSDEDRKALEDSIARMTPWDWLAEMLGSSQRDEDGMRPTRLTAIDKFEKGLAEGLPTIPYDTADFVISQLLEFVGTPDSPNIESKDKIVLLLKMALGQTYLEFYEDESSAVFKEDFSNLLSLVSQFLYPDKPNALQKRWVVNLPEVQTAE